MWLEVAHGGMARASTERCISCVGHVEERVAGTGDMEGPMARGSMERDVAGWRHEILP